MSARSHTTGLAIRLDTEHAVQELMKSAVARICRAVRVEICEQHIYLTGAAASWHEKQLAQEALRSISGSYRICNKIAVPAWESR